MAGQWQRWGKGPGFLMPPWTSADCLAYANRLLWQKLAAEHITPCCYGESTGTARVSGVGGQCEHQPADENEDGPLDLFWPQGPGPCIGLIAVLAFSGLLGRQMEMVTIRWG